MSVWALMQPEVLAVEMNAIWKASNGQLLINFDTRL
jgi:hypothetical protein